MSFSQAIRTVFSKYFTLSGRAGKAEFWWFVLLWFVVDAVLSFLRSRDDGALLTTILGLVAIFLIIPFITVTVRRLHDTGRSGWWWWLHFIPLIGTIVLVIFCVGESQGPNKYGPGPEPAIAA
ncbi:uncharacterized membrane protein YhaH (DUF805 family) [Branchiibius hedensis]|uniref:Uncharacterized membrane protein YhaH, DUF805 family n=1 Tax=Branchiibius hedensis TaxID=672460 RepID=A0A2Y8ZTV0_9MICO|nr:DUF805 domain-containing protein [Branchiibius hedensis]PWJ26612.1 uncharacterized membrane protein YhaH (DUF805 family) [Branchiibius hedensis]SSA35424.1 Uncharacterized membrane protein YhaH, DUF805 family [Branchiibius hedensis]